MRSFGVLVLGFASVVGFQAAGDIIIPTSAYANGAGSPPALFATNVRILNPANDAISLSLVFYDASKTPVEETRRDLSVGGLEQVQLDNILVSLFSRSIGSFGPIRIVTEKAPVVSSVTFNTRACGSSLSGQWVPGIDASRARKAGVIPHLARSVDDVSGFRTNIGFLYVGDEAEGASVTLRVRRGSGTLLYNGPVSAAGRLLPNRLLQQRLSSLPGVAGASDTNLWLEFESDRAVVAFATVIANEGTNDPYTILPSSANGED